MKTVCVLLLGWILFDSSLTFKNVIGMMMAILGMVLYSSAMEASKQVPPKTPLPLLKGMSFVSDDEDVSLLKSSKDIEGGKPNSNWVELSKMKNLGSNPSVSIVMHLKCHSHSHSHSHSTRQGLQFIFSFLSSILFSRPPYLRLFESHARCTAMQTLNPNSWNHERRTRDSDQYSHWMICAEFD